MSTHLKIIVPITIVAAGLGIYGLLHHFKPEPDKNDEAPRPLSARTVPVSQEAVTLQVTTQGEIRARTDIDIVAQVGGKIVWVSPEFTEGGSVEPGVSLLRIEDTDYRLALSEAEARVAEARVRVEQALADADVARKQLRNEANPSDLALKKPQVAEARARLDAAVAQLEQARLNLERTAIDLPFAGRLVDTRVDIGQYVVPGSVVGRAFGTEMVETRLSLNNAQLAALGLPIGYTAPPGEGLPVQLRAEVAGREHQWEGELVRLDASIDPGTRMLYGIAEVVDPYGANVSEYGMPLAVGLFVTATIEGRQLPTAHVIPRSALRAGDLVYLVNDQERLEVRNVEVLHANDVQAVIGSGLEAGERAIISPIRNPVQGMALIALESGTASR
jgi:RND family efflux transporter MFP subunit